ncbi:MAG: hypothetical protein COB07_08520 [Sulfurovum sp.]|nr:MAG: hypothetical protein COB07_08520 [Sulfurovum sp.]
MKNILLVVLLSVFGLAAKVKHTTFTCEFTTYATEKGSFSDDVMRFTLVTNDNNSTYIRKGSKDEFRGKILRGDKGLSFVEVSKRNNITTTTMSSLSSDKDEHKAVHSSNRLLDGKLLASQYYGTCHRVDEILTQKVSFPISPNRRRKIIKKLNVDQEIKKLSKQDAKYVKDALRGVFPSRQEMEQDMSIEGMILVGRIMDDAMKAK